MKLIKKFDDVISVYFDKEWNVFKVVVDGRPEATAEEDEKQDAFDTAAAMVRRRAEHPEAYEPEALREGVARRVGEWDIGKVKDEPETGREIWWFGHHSTDEEMGSGNVWITDGEVTDYDGVYSLRPEVVKAFALEGFDVSYVEGV